MCHGTRMCCSTQGAHWDVLQHTRSTHWDVVRHTRRSLRCVTAQGCVAAHKEHTLRCATAHKGHTLRWGVPAGPGGAFSARPGLMIASNARAARRLRYVPPLWWVRRFMHYSHRCMGSFPATQLAITAHSLVSSCRPAHGLRCAPPIGFKNRGHALTRGSACRGTSWPHAGCDLALKGHSLASWGCYLVCRGCSLASWICSLDLFGADLASWGCYLVLFGADLTL